jgi:hypothetical protein
LVNARKVRRSSNFLKQPFFPPVSTIRSEGIRWIVNVVLALNDVLEPDAAIRLELRVLRVVPAKLLHCYQQHNVCSLGTHWHRLQCAHQCAQTRSKSHHSAANANQGPNKNGPEIVNFRPVLRFLVALANRRLQPLGHLTANAKSN